MKTESTNDASAQEPVEQNIQVVPTKQESTTTNVEQTIKEKPKDNLSNFKNVEMINIDSALNYLDNISKRNPNNIWRSTQTAYRKRNGIKGSDQTWS